MYVYKVAKQLNIFWFDMEGGGRAAEWQNDNALAMATAWVCFHRHHSCTHIHFQLKTTPNSCTHTRSHTHTHSSSHTYNTTTTTILTQHVSTSTVSEPASKPYGWLHTKSLYTSLAIHTCINVCACVSILLPPYHKMKPNKQSSHIHIHSVTTTLTLLE